MFFFRVYTTKLNLSICGILNTYLCKQAYNVYCLTIQGVPQSFSSHPRTIQYTISGIDPISFSLMHFIIDYVFRDFICQVTLSGVDQCFQISAVQCNPTITNLYIINYYVHSCQAGVFQMNFES